MTDASAESRDRAIAEANALRQENAELFAALRGLAGFVQLMAAKSSLTEVKRKALLNNHRVTTAMALIAKRP